VDGANTTTRVTYLLAGQAVAVRVSGDPDPANNGLHYLYADHLGSISAMSDENGQLVGGITRYTPFGDYRSGGPNPITDRAYTGQRENMSLGLYYYNARWYSPSLARFLSADTIVPAPTSPQSLNRYAYTLNSPLNYSDPTGHSECGVGQYHCKGDEPQSTVVVLGGSDPGKGISKPGPNVRAQMPAWNTNPWGYDMLYVRYPGSKYEQYKAMIVQDIGEPRVIVAYSAGAEAALMYASSHASLESVILLGPTFTGGDVQEGEDIGFEGWSRYMEQTLINGTNIIIVDDGFRLNQDAYSWAKNADMNLADAGIPPGTFLLYLYLPLAKHYDDGRIKTGSNNNPWLVKNLFEYADGGAPTCCQINRE